MSNSERLECQRSSSLHLINTCKGLIEDLSAITSFVSYSTKESKRFAGVIQDLLQSSSEQTSDTAASKEIRDQCPQCATLGQEIVTIRKECDQLEYLKPFNQELVNQNELLRFDVKQLEKEITELKENHVENDLKLHQSMSSISNLKQEVQVVRHQLLTCERYLDELNKRVQKASLRFVELETVSQHQRCMLTDCYQVIDMLKAELAEQQLIEPATDIEGRMICELSMNCNENLISTLFCYLIN